MFLITQLDNFRVKDIKSFLSIPVLDQMESTHTNTLESQDSKMGLGLVRQRGAIVASDE